MSVTTDKRPEGAISLRPHAPESWKRLPWPVCSHCGLVYLKNEATRRLIQRGCWKFADEK